METLVCETCGEVLEQRENEAAGQVFRCPNQHWWLLSPTLGWLVIPSRDVQPAEEVSE